MLPLLAVVGAFAMFMAGWLVARLLGRGDASTPPAVAEQVVVSEIDVVDRHPSGVVVCAPSGSIEYRNQAARLLVGTHTGVLLDEAIDKHLRSARAGSPTEDVLEFFGPPKQVMAVSTQALPGGRAVAFIDDISARRRADQVRTDFVANVSHELRTPIGALMVLAETLVDADEPEVVDRIIGRMQGEAQRASRTIDDLLQLSELEAATDREYGPVSLSDVVSDAVTRVTELAEQNDISISTLDPIDPIDPVGPSGPVASGLVVRGDRRQLASAVGNVVENAVKYSDPGGNVQVRVRQAAEWGEIVVADDGPGIPRRDLDRIFERFYRVDRARSRTSGGTGLGLSIVRHVLQNHAGTIEVKSTEGEGSTFVLRLPLIINEGHGVESTTDQEGVA